MDKTFRCIIKRLEEYKKTHRRVDIGRKRRQFIRNSYERLKIIENKASIGVRYNKSYVKMRIVSPDLFSCSQVPTLSDLIGISDTFFIRKCRQGIMVDMEFKLWRWVEKTD